jgi:hypothetical protein
MGDFLEGADLVLDEARPLLARGGAVQIGWGPETAVLLDPPPGVSPTRLAAAMRLLDGRHSRQQLLWGVEALGVPWAGFEEVLAALLRGGFARKKPPAREAPPRVRVHGEGPLAAELGSQLSAAGAAVSHSALFPTNTEVRQWAVDFVVLAGEPVVDRRLVAELVALGLPHLHTYVRDDRAVVGPLVLPGKSACLGCVELVRAELDPEWPALARQLAGRRGRANRATLAAAAAFALPQVAAGCAPEAPGPGSLANATLEVDAAAGTVIRRHWPRQADCVCASPSGPAARAPGELAESDETSHDGARA